jgi:hypothetical protein
VSQNPVFLDNEIVVKLKDLRMNVTSFAIEHILSELMAMRLSKQNPDHVSHVKPGQKCLCKLRKNYSIPCRHILSKYEGVIPLEAVHERWRITYINGSGKADVFLSHSAK